MTGIDWRDHAACLASGVEFVDVDRTAAPMLVRSYCRTCPVVAPCREQADQRAPYRWRTVAGARVYEAREPVDGWAAS